MRFVKSFVILAVLLSTFAVAQKNFFVLPTKDNVSVYANQVREMNEKAVAVVNKTDRLKVLETTRKHYKVKLDNGSVAWIEKSLASKTEGKVETFEDVEVQGYLDNPTPLYITDMDQGESAPVDIDRSFKDALRRNVDKDIVNRTM